MKILVVDDNSDDRRLLRYIIERKGHEAIEAEDGLAGLRMAKIHRPDLIISDALMPLMDGYQFLRQVKADETTATIPFIFYSATYRADRDVDLALALGAEAYIIKPKEPAQLWEEVEIILQGSEKEKTITPELISEDEEYLKRYSQVVAAKLEEKMRELQEAKAKVEESEAFIRNILESVDEGFIVIDRDYRIIMANEAYMRTLKKSRDEVIGRRCYECSHDIDKPCYENEEDCPARQTFESEKSHSAVHTHFDADGSPVYVEIKSYPMKNAAGEVSSVIEICIDITEKVKLENQLRQAQKLEAIGMLAGGIAHDFNNMLGVIIGYGSLLQRKMQEDDPCRSYIDRMLVSAEMAAELSRSLLVFSRKQPISPQPVDLNRTIRNIEKLLSRIIAADIHLKTDLTEEDLIIMADSGQIEQVLMNLVTNARDAMPGGGSIEIGSALMRLDEQSARELGIGVPGAYAVMSVTDTGTGLGEETRKRIFEPFFTTKEPGKGTGLGLSIVYGIVKQHNGHITVESSAGKGSEFRIFLPVIAAGAAGRKREEQQALRGGTETILLAEDSEPVRTVTAFMLKEYGYDVISASDGQDAIEKFMRNKESISLCLIDLIMPKKSGRKVYEEIRKISPSVKVVFMTGYFGQDTAMEDIVGGDAELIMKPVSSEGLLAKVREILDR